MAKEAGVMCEGREVVGGRWRCLSRNDIKILAFSPYFYYHIVRKPISCFVLLVWALILFNA